MKSILQQRGQSLLRKLKKVYARARVPDAFVLWSTPLELVVATMLSAQCTDVRVNLVTRELFKKYRTAADYANAPVAELERAIGSITFFRAKSRYLQGIGRVLVERFGGEVPRTVEELILLPGVAYKSANLIMAKEFGVQTGVAVDTHVTRVAARLGLTKSKNPIAIAADLEALFPRKNWLEVNEYMILHGRAVCRAPRPKCEECPVRDLCPSARLYLKKKPTK
ncbi:MAG: endonuclease III [Patescibacteria group bacterium]